jgi:hypothetical protein
MKNCDAVKAALSACVVPEHRELVVLVPCWKNGFFGSDPFRWAEIARRIGSNVGEILHARWVFMKGGETHDT